MKNLKNVIYLMIVFTLLVPAGCKGSSGDDDEPVTYIHFDRLNNPGGSEYDEFNAVIESGDYYIAAGRSMSDLSDYDGVGGSDTAGWYDFVMAKFNKSDLSIDTLKNFGANDDDVFTDLIESGDYYIAVGYSYSDLSVDFSDEGGSDTTGWYDFVIAKLNKSDFSFVELNNLGGLADDFFYSVIESGDYYIAVGKSDSDLSVDLLAEGGSNNTGNTGESDFVIAKFNKSNLSLDSINNPGGTGYDYFRTVIESGDYYIAVGYSISDLSGLSGGSDTEGDYDFVIAKFNKSNLGLVSMNNFGGTSGDYFYSVIESGDYYIAAGYSASDLSDYSSAGGTDTTGESDFVIAKFNKSNLGLVSLKNFGGIDTDRFYSVIESGDYYIASGDTRSDLSGLTGGSNYQGLFDFVVAKINKSDFSLVNIHNCGGTDNEYYNSIISSGDYFIAAGQSESDLSGLAGGSIEKGENDFVIARYYQDVNLY